MCWCLSSHGSLGVFIILFGIASFASLIFLISGIQEKNTAISDLEIAKRNIEDYEKNLDKRLKAIAAQGQAQAAQNAAKHPTCPICGSHNTERISTLNRTVSIATVGLASSKIGKKMSSVKLWLYFAKNRPYHTFELSRTECEKWGLKTDAYHDAVNDLITKGYLQNIRGNEYFFNEKGANREMPISS